MHVYCMYIHTLRIHRHIYICLYTYTHVCGICFLMWFRRNLGYWNLSSLNFLILNRQLNAVFTEEGWATKEYLILRQVGENRAWSVGAITYFVGQSSLDFSFIRNAKMWYWLLNSVGFCMVQKVETKFFPLALTFPKLRGNETMYFAVVFGSGCWYLSWTFVKETIRYNGNSSELWNGRSIKGHVAPICEWFLTPPKACVSHRLQTPFWRGWIWAVHGGGHSKKYLCPPVPPGDRPGAPKLS